ncbi:hypothetical protein Tco_1175517 [Tanacetum coccineum]
MTKERPAMLISLLKLDTSTMRVPNVPITHTIMLMFFHSHIEGAARIWLEKEHLDPLNLGRSLYPNSSTSFSILLRRRNSSQWITDFSRAGGKLLGQKLAERLKKYREPSKVRQTRAKAVVAKSGKKLSLPVVSNLADTELADSINFQTNGNCHPKRTFRLKVGVFHFPADFVVVDFVPDPRVPFISRGVVLLYKTSVLLIVVHKMTSLIWLVRNTLKEVLGFTDVIDKWKFTPASILTSVPPLPPPSQGNKSNLFSQKSELSLKSVNLITANFPIDEPSEVDSRNCLPFSSMHFWKGDKMLPVIIAKELDVEEKIRFIKPFSTMYVSILSMNWLRRKQWSLYGTASRSLEFFPKLHSRFDHMLQRLLRKGIEVDNKAKSMSLQNTSSHLRQRLFRCSSRSCRFFPGGSIPDISKISDNDTHLLEKEYPSIFFRWTASRAFQTMKDRLRQLQYLMLQTVTSIVSFLCDAQADFAIGLTSHEQSIAACTDHSALKYLFAKKDAKASCSDGFSSSNEFDSKFIDLKEPRTWQRSSVQIGKPV